MPQLASTCSNLLRLTEGRARFVGAAQMGACTGSLLTAGGPLGHARDIRPASGMPRHARKPTRARHTRVGIEPTRTDAAPPCPWPFRTRTCKCQTNMHGPIRALAPPPQRCLPARRSCRHSTKHCELWRRHTLRPRQPKCVCAMQTASRAGLQMPAAQGVGAPPHPPILPLLPAHAEATN
jgi:hypothetical protein